MFREMPGADDRIEDAVTALQRAPLRGGWPSSLARLANVVGGWAATLFTISPRNGLLSFASGGVSEETIRASVAAGGLDPAINPRMMALKAAIPMRGYTEQDIPNLISWDASPYYRKFAHPADVPHALFAKLAESEADLTGLIVWRSAQQGPATAEEREIFIRLLPTVRQAHHHQLELDRRVLRLAAQLWDSQGKSALYCDANLELLAMSSATEKAIADCAAVSLKNNRLHFSSEDLQREFKQAVSAACGRCAEGEYETTLQATSADGSRRSVFVIMPVPEGESGDLLLLSAALVLFADDKPIAEVDGFVRLTKAEEDIGHKLLQGMSTRQIAEMRGASITTVQTQIKAMNQKLGAAHRAELIGLLRRRCES